MDLATIKEARRLLRDLVFQGEAILKAGTVISPKPEILVMLWEKIASKKVEETETPIAVDGFQLKGTHHTRDIDAETQGGPLVHE